MKKLYLNVEHSPESNDHEFMKLNTVQLDEKPSNDDKTPVQKGKNSSYNSKFVV
jgi:hypothetical protein